MSVTVHNAEATVQLSGDRIQVVTVGTKGDPGEPGTGTLVFNESPTGARNGTNAIFTIAHAPNSGGLLSLNGQVLTPGAGKDYTLSGNTLTLVTPPESGDELLITYAY